MKIFNPKDPHAALHTLMREVRTNRSASPLQHTGIARGATDVEKDGAIRVIPNSTSPQEIYGTAALTNNADGQPALLYDGGSRGSFGPIKQGYEAIGVERGEWSVGVDSGNAYIGYLKDSATLGTNRGFLIQGNGPMLGFGQLTMMGSQISDGYETYGLRLMKVRQETFGTPLEINSQGYVTTASSTEATKLNIKPVELNADLLNIPMVDWVDRNQAEAYAELLSRPRPYTEDEQALHDDPTTLRRVIGAVAERVEEVDGGSQFCTYDRDGNLTGLRYDRFALARTAILAKKLAAAEDRIARLERIIAEKFPEDT